MSEPVANVEIEDVLSSIRRLVSDDGVKDATVVAPERFVLTPALRVAETPEQLEQVDVERAAPMTLEQALKNNDTMEFIRAARNEPPLAERIAVLEAAVSDTQDEWEPDGSEDDAEERSTTHIFESSRSRPVANSAEPELEKGTPAEEPAHESAEVDTDEPEVENFEPTNEPIILHQVDQLNVDDEISPEDDNVEVDLFASSKSPNDDSLREMVNEIVRQELQGEMGERITRNVRRMVRREIQRAMSMKGFE